MYTTLPDQGGNQPAGFHLPDDAALSARYEILSEVGRGGMGVVYRARHKLLGMAVAIKVMLPHAGAERFLREARILATIRSPYVVRVHDYELLSNGGPVLVMEWVEGTNLLQVIKGHGFPLPEDRVLPWMRNTCEGMLAAAEQGVIHRDLKPSNLLIDAQGRVRVADFGLARGPAVQGDLSKSGLVLGTPYYMAPEQAEDPRSVDTRADIYSFGATFYHALVGRPPFEGETPFSVLWKHKTEALASPRARRPELSARMGELLERCLAKAPIDRFSSFAEILEHLQPSPKVSSPWLDSDDAELTVYLARYRERRDAYLRDRTVWNGDLDVYRFPRGQTLRVMRGDLPAQQVEALVSSTTSYLNMDSGVSEAICKAGGGEIVEQALCQAPVRPGRVAVTTGGKLAARLVFHGVTVGWVGGEVVRPSRDLITEILASCFYHADTHGVRSIAFPLLGTGAQRFPREVCLDTMFHYLARMLLRGITPVCEARIVLFDPEW
jgi:serine/threonine protein kinase